MAEEFFSGTSRDLKARFTRVKDLPPVTWWGASKRSKTQRGQWNNFGEEKNLNSLTFSYKGGTKPIKRSDLQSFTALIFSRYDWKLSRSGQEGTYDLAKEPSEKASILNAKLPLGPP